MFAAGIWDFSRNVKTFRISSRFFRFSPLKSRWRCGVIKRKLPSSNKKQNKRNLSLKSKQHYAVCVYVFQGDYFEMHIKYNYVFDKIPFKNSTKLAEKATCFERINMFSSGSWHEYKTSIEDEFKIMYISFTILMLKYHELRMHKYWFKIKTESNSIVASNNSLYF